MEGSDPPTAPGLTARPAQTEGVTRSLTTLFEAPLAPIRTQLAHALRSRVAGEDADAEAGRIWGATGPRWFGPQDAIWRVHADASMFVGGIRALLLQSLHPLAMAGVAGHSGYKSDPWGRLQRTSNFLATTTFSTTANAEAAIARVRSIHDRVRGKAPDGRPYRAGDPHLLAWVHVAEADSFLSTYQAYGPGRLTPAECDEYVAQSAITASALGVLDPPTTAAELAEALAAYRPELEATPAALEATRFLLYAPAPCQPARATRRSPPARSPTCPNGPDTPSTCGCPARSTAWPDRWWDDRWGRSRQASSAGPCPTPRSPGIVAPASAEAPTRHVDRAP